MSIVKRLQFTVRYGEDYVIGEEDAVRLLAIAARCQRVERENYSGPYSYAPADKNDPFVQTISLIEVDVPDEETAQPSIYTAAARGLP